MSKLIRLMIIKDKHLDKLGEIYSFCSKLDNDYILVVNRDIDKSYYNKKKKFFI